MAETIAEVFIRLGTSGVSEASRAIAGLDSSLSGLGQTAKTAYAALNPNIVNSVIDKQKLLEQQFNEGSITIHQFVESLRVLQKESRVLTASFSEREAMAGGLLRRFGITPEAKQEVADFRRVVAELILAGNLTREQGQQIVAGPALEKQQREMEVLQKVSKEMSRGIAQDAKDREAAEKAFLRALEKSKQEMSRGVSDVRKDENETRLRAAAITRQQETAQETFNRKIAEYNALRAAGAISEQTHVRAVASANRELEHNVRLHEMGKKGIFGSREAMIQLSYALQDAAITWDQGLGRAMQASANNFGMIIPMMTKSIGLGMGLSVGFTALATAISMWERSSKKATEESEKLNKSLGDLPAILNKIAEAQKNMLSMRDLLFEGSASSLESAARSKGREASLAREQAGVAAQASADAAAKATSEATKGMARGNINDPDVERRLREELVKRNVVGLTRAAANAGAPDTDAVRRQIQADAERMAAEEIKSIKEKVAASEDVRKAVEEENKASSEAARLRQEQVAAQKAHVEAVSQEIYALEREERAKRKAAETAEKSAAAQNRRETINRVERGLMSEPRQTAFGAFEEFQRNIEAIAGAGGMTPEEKAAMAGKTGELFQNTLNKTETDKTKSRFQPNFAGFSDFGRQFQMSLFEDPAAKDRKEQIRLQREANDEVRRLADALLGGVPGLPRFAPGGN